MSDPLIEQVAAAVAPGYRDLVPGNAAGVLLRPSWGEDLAPFASELKEVHEDVSPYGDQEELGLPEVEDSAATTELMARLQDDDDALPDYWLTLAAQLHTLLGIPVLVHDVDMPIGEQYRRQTGTPEEDPLAGMDVLVSVRIDAYQTAAVTLREGLWMYGIARGTDPQDSVPVSIGVTELRRNPQVVAGSLPRGATGVRIQDRTGTWHAAAVGRGAWLCVLPQRARGGEEPPFEYVDAAGERVELDGDAWVVEQTDLCDDEVAVRQGALVPAVWFAADHDLPIFDGWDGPRERATALRFVHGGSEVRSSAEPVTAAEAFTQRLIRAHGYGTAGARRRIRNVTLSTLPGTFDGEPVTLELAAFTEDWDRADGWAAVLQTDAFSVTVQGEFAPPDRIDLRTH